VSVISGRTNTVVATVRNVATPVGVAVNPRTNTIYIHREPDGQELRFAICVPQHVADGEFDPAGLRRYLARPPSHAIWVVPRTSHDLV